MNEKGKMENVLAKVKKELGDVADAVVPWFFENMHDYYFRSHSEEEQVQHIHAIVSGQVSSQSQSVVLKSPCGTKVTYITPGSDSSYLVDILEQLKKTPLQMARIYTSFDQALQLDTFHFVTEDKKGISDTGLLQSILAKSDIPEDKEDKFAKFLSCASTDYVEKYDRTRAKRHFAILEEIANTERLHVYFHDRPYADQDRIILAMNKPPGSGTLWEVAKILKRHDIPLLRVYLDLFHPRDRDRVLIITLYVAHTPRLHSTSQPWKELSEELAMIKWYRSGILDRYADDRKWSIKKVSLLQAACKYSRHFLLQRDPYIYSSDRVARTVLKYPDTVSALIDFFEAKFDPRLPDNKREESISKAGKAAEQGMSDIPEGPDRTVLEEVYAFFGNCLKTNYFKPSPFGLSFRLGPVALQEKEDGEKPYGMFFFHGPSYQGFHVRYRDMARGGIRIVRTKTLEQYELESNRLLTEVLALAGSQQRKNKDIPEGGAKAVLLLRSYGDMDLAVRSMTDILLDLIISTKSTTCPDYVVDYLGDHELIYVGPDENITEEHIEWMVNRASHRGYEWPSTLMSSKPKTGINHKEYGVTSLGVMVFVEEVLKALNIDPSKDDFRIKMTGGPRGDVAGNAIKIIAEAYGKRCKIVAVSDGHGAAFDTEGLDQDELLRLVRKEKSISGFNPGKIAGKTGFVTDVSTPEGVKLRNELHNTAPADVFVPAGGRPDTINRNNWDRFLTQEHTPSAPAIVEGANIFISTEAREKLEEAGVLFVHGSSANKTGVITSSYEVLAGLILTEDEFISIKNEYVRDVKEILRQKAGDEARLLVREYNYSGRSRRMTDISFSASAEINELGDRVCEVLFKEVPDLQQDEPLCDLLLSYCPPVLVRHYTSRIIEKIPTRYQFAILGANIASRIVYSEGLGWLRKMAELREIRKVIKVYLREEKRVAQYIRRLQESNLEDREIMAKIIQARGRTYLTAEELGLER